jgi:hypothetical protein
MPNWAAFFRIVAVGRFMRLAIVSSDCDAAASLVSSRCCLNDHGPIFRLPAFAIISPCLQPKPHQLLYRLGPGRRWNGLLPAPFFDRVDVVGGHHDGDAVVFDLIWSCGKFFEEKSIVLFLSHNSIDTRIGESATLRFGPANTVCRFSMPRA